MSLESGKYTITMRFDGAPVGRKLIEPRDTSPKGIFKLPQDMAAHPTTVSNADVPYILQVCSLMPSII